ncbi:MAG: sodium:solute symporter family protein [Planctomycetota bacterium]
MTVQVLVVVTYLLVLVAIGWYSSRRSTGTAEDYFLAGRSFGGIVLFMALFGTNVTAFGMLGFPGFVYREGIGAFGFFGAAAALISPLLFIVLGYPIWNVGRRNGYITQSQMFADRWGSQLVGFLFFALPTFYTFLYLSVGVLGGALAVEEIAKIPYVVAAAMVTGVAVLYTALGGMRGTAWTNVFQASVFLLFLVVACIGIAHSLGGGAHLHQRLVVEAPEALARPGAGILSPASWAFGFLVGPASVIAFPHMFMRLLAARDMTSMRRTIAVYPWALMLLFVPVTLIGLWGRVAEPGLIGKEADRILPLLVEAHLPTWLTAVGLAAVLAAVMSSIDAQLLSLSTMFTVDVVGRGKQVQVWPGRIALLLVAMAAFLVAWWRPASILKMALYIFSGYTLLIPIMVAAFFWRRSTALAAVLAIVAGHVLLACYYSGALLGDAFELSLPTFGVLPVVWCLLVEVVLLLLVSLAFGGQDNAGADRFATPFQGAGR